MMKIMAECWGRNVNKLKTAISQLDECPGNYEDLVKITFDTICNGDEVFRSSTCGLNTNKITTIDDGDYQGTLMFMIPMDCYQPSPDDYILTYAWYGSCSGCDALQHIDSLGDYGEPLTDAQKSDLLALCRGILAAAVCPYNHGWRHTDIFDLTDEEEA